MRAERSSEMVVRRASKALCEKFVISKHYSRSKSIFWEGFCLVIDGKVEGVAVYGQPSPAIQKHAFKDKDFRLYELSRVVVQTPRKNAASFLVANSLKMLRQQPCAVVSYADTAHNHCGILYQATNWKYTGATKSHDKLYLIEGKATHSMTLRDKGITAPAKWAKEHGIETIPPMVKHRYFVAVGTRKQKKRIYSKLNYSELPSYPKLDSKRYDDGPQLNLRLKE